MSSFKVVSIFRTIQGEGRNSGMNSIFIRLHTKRCFFKSDKFCSFCDTRNKAYFAKYNEMSLQNIFDTLSELELSDERVIITGGEPFAEGIEEISNLCEAIKSEFQNCSVDIETNGSFLTYKNPAVTYRAIATLMANVSVLTISPKTDVFTYDFECMSDIVSTFGKQVDFKFVVDGDRFDRDVKAAETFSNMLLTKNVFLMPRTPCSIDVYKCLFNYCSKKKYNFSPRLHVMLFGDAEYEV